MKKKSYFTEYSNHINKKNKCLKCFFKTSLRLNVVQIVSKVS